jgi:outer membrane cobalamin receptor
LFERYGVDNYGLVGNPNLKPETAQSWDAGIEKDFALFGNRKFASAGSTYFETSTRNLIQYNFGPQVQYVNVARAEISGTESWIHAKPLSWLESDINWTWLRSVNASGQTFASTPDGKPLLRRPQNTIAGSVTVMPTEVWRITPKLRYVSSKYDVLYDNNGAFTGRGRVGGYTLVDLATDYKLVDHISLYSTIRNLFDRAVESPNGYLQEPLTIMVGLKYQ